MEERHPRPHRFWRALWVLFATTIILLAFVVSLARIFLPLIDNYREEIQDWASTQMGRPVTIGKIEVAWRGVQPIIRFRDVQVMTRERKPWLKLKEVQTFINLNATVASGSVRSERINLVEPVLDLVRQKDGSYTLAGRPLKLPAQKAAPEADKALQKFLAHNRLGVVGGVFRLHDDRISKQPLRLEKINMVLEATEKGFLFNGSTRIFGKRKQTVLFVANLKKIDGRLFSRLYLQGSVELGKWVNGSMFSQADMRGGRLRFRLWGDGYNVLQNLSGELALEKLEWGLKVPVDKEGTLKLQEFALDALSGRFHWKRESAGWGLDIDQFVVSRGKSLWPVTKMHLSHRSSKAGKYTVNEGYFSFMRLQDIDALVQAVPGLNVRLRQVLEGMQIRGDVRDLAVRLYVHEKGQNRLFMKAGFKDYGQQAWAGGPGVSGLDGYLILNDTSGFVTLDSREGRLSVPALFDEPIELARLKGRFFWKQLPDGWRVDARDVSAASQDIEAIGQVSVRRSGKDKSPFVDLRVAFKEGDASQAYRYLPRKRMNKNVVRWLDRALKGGRIKQGNFVYFGRPRDFPFKKGEGNFDVTFDVENMTLDYQAGWPQLEKLDATINFHNRSFGMKMKSGTIFGMKMKGASARINDMGKDGLLVVNADVEGELKKMLGFLANSPIGKGYAKFLSGVQSKGSSRLRFNMELPIARASGSKSEGVISFRGNSLQLSEWHAGVEKMTGNLKFSSDNSGVTYTGNDIEAKFRGQPALITIYTHGAGQSRQVFIDLRGKMSMAELAGQQGKPLANFTKGRASWLLRTIVSDLSKQTRADILVLVESDLKGISINMPGGLGKKAAEKRLFRISSKLADNRIGNVRVSYGKLLSSVFSLKRGKKGAEFDRGQLVLGAGSAKMPDKPGLWVRGRLPVLAFEPWQRWVEQSKGTYADSGFIDRISEIDLEIGQVSVFGFTIDKVGLKIDRQPQFYKAVIKGPAVNGIIRVPFKLSGQNPVIINMPRLHLKRRVNTSLSRLTKDQLASVDIRQFPNLTIHSDAFSINDMYFGELTFIARREFNQVFIDRMEMISPTLSLNLTGNWKQTKEGHFTSMKATANSKNFGKALRVLGFRKLVDDGELRFSASLSWKSPMFLIDAYTLSGKATLAVDKASLLEIDQGGGKVLGLFSLNMLSRRLLLDFKDLYKRGFAFDKLRGSFEIEDGDAYTNDMYIKAPSALIEISGRIGLATKDYRQEVLVTPRVAASMPVLGGLISPQLGVGVWLADKVFGGKIDKMSQVRYFITGSWDKPVITRAGSKKPLKQKQQGGDPDENGDEE